MSSPRLAERNRRIREEAAKGRTYQDIGDEFGISRQRVDQIMKPVRARARMRLTHALASGDIERADQCSRCGDEGDIQAHHPDYDRPLEVEWLCVSCHVEEHVGQERRVPAKYRPVEWTCEVCGKTEMRKPLRADVRFCSSKCYGLAERFDRSERVEEIAEQLREHVESLGYIPGTVEFAMHATGKSKNTAVATLCQYVDPSHVHFGSYAAVMDAIYEAAGFPRPRYGSLPLSAVDRGAEYVDRMGSFNRSAVKRSDDSEAA